MKKYYTILQVNAKKPKFGKLTAIAFAPTKYLKWGERRMIICKCECGKQREAALKDFIDGSCRHCGCEHHHKKVVKHGFCRKEPHPLFNTWVLMRGRCSTKNHHRINGTGVKE